ncbi:MAG: hypothetical protein V4563_18240 [Pseudomonadota bacterium]
MNVLYLLKILESNQLADLVAHMDMPPLDMNLALWQAIDDGEIEIDEKKGKVKALKEAEPWHNPELANKLLRCIQHYAKNESNITVGRLNSYMKDPSSGNGYPVHEYLMSMQYLIDNGTVVEEVVSMPKTPKRPYHKFVFLCLPENDNAEWNARAVNKWIDDFAKSNVK